jgi:hypothetical protein
LVGWGGLIYDIKPQKEKEEKKKKKKRYFFGGRGLFYIHTYGVCYVREEEGSPKKKKKKKASIIQCSGDFPRQAAFRIDHT